MAATTEKALTGEKTVSMAYNPATGRWETNVPESTAAQWVRQAEQSATIQRQQRTANQQVQPQYEIARQLVTAQPQPTQQAVLITPMTEKGEEIKEQTRAFIQTTSGQYKPIAPEVEKAIVETYKELPSGARNIHFAVEPSGKEGEKILRTTYYEPIAAKPTEPSQPIKLPDVISGKSKLTTGGLPSYGQRTATFEEISSKNLWKTFPTRVTEIKYHPIFGDIGFIEERIETKEIPSLSVLLSGKKAEPPTTGLGLSSWVSQKIGSQSEIAPKIEQEGFVITKYQEPTLKEHVIGLSKGIIVGLAMVPDFIVELIKRPESILEMSESFVTTGKRLISPETFAPAAGEITGQIIASYGISKGIGKVYSYFKEPSLSAQILKSEAYVPEQPEAGSRLTASAEAVIKAEGKDIAARVETDLGGKITRLTAGEHPAAEITARTTADIELMRVRQWLSKIAGKEVVQVKEGAAEYAVKAEAIETKPSIYKTSTYGQEVFEPKMRIDFIQSLTEQSKLILERIKETGKRWLSRGEAEKIYEKQLTTEVEGVEKPAIRQLETGGFVDVTKETGLMVEGGYFGEPSEIGMYAGKAKVFSVRVPTPAEELPIEFVKAKPVSATEIITKPAVEAVTAAAAQESAISAGKSAVIEEISKTSPTPVILAPSGAYFSKIGTITEKEATPVKTIKTRTVEEQREIYSFYEGPFPRTKETIKELTKNIRKEAEATKVGFGTSAIEGRLMEEISPTAEIQIPRVIPIQTETQLQQQLQQQQQRVRQITETAERVKPIVPVTVERTVEVPSFIPSFQIAEKERKRMRKELPVKFRTKYFERLHKLMPIEEVTGFGKLRFDEGFELPKLGSKRGRKK